MEKAKKFTTGAKKNSKIRTLILQLFLSKNLPEKSKFDEGLLKSKLGPLGGAGIFSCSGQGTPHIPPCPCVLPLQYIVCMHEEEEEVAPFEGAKSRKQLSSKSEEESDRKLFCHAGNL